MVYNWLWQELERVQVVSYIKQHIDGSVIMGEGLCNVSSQSIRELEIRIKNYLFQGQDFRGLITAISQRHYRICSLMRKCKWT